MANYNPAWATSGPIRYPTTDEQNLGYQCGAFDVGLLNALMYQLQAELKAVIDQGGITHTNANMTCVRDAILNMIAAATGGSGDFVLMSQARARLPIHAEVLSPAGTMNITTPSTGTVRVPSGSTLLHRGIFEVVTAEEDFATAASKTYHLRWTPSGGFALEDLADSLYNPTTLVESNVAFDSTYDDVLIARVVTNSSNASTITNLSNKASLWMQSIIQGTNVYKSGINFASYLFQKTLNWARTPLNYSFSVAYNWQEGNRSDGDQSLHDPAVTESQWNAGNRMAFGAATQFPVTRYETRFRYMNDWSVALSFDAAFRA